MNSKEAILLAEYQAAHNSFHHYDNFRWQSGSMLIASSLVIWGFLISNSVGVKSIGITSIFITLILSAWIFYAHHYRQLYMSKLYRIHEIEKELSMALNIRHGFLGITEKHYYIFGPKGHNIDRFIFVIISLFGPILTLFEKGFSFWLCASLPVVLIAIALVSINESKMMNFYRSQIAMPNKAS